MVDDKNITKTPQTEEEEFSIDYVAYAKLLWSKRKLIIKIFAVFFVLGLVFALTNPKAYTVSTTIVPQLSNAGSMNSGKLGALASIAGISMGDITSKNGELSPLVYPQIFNNIELKKELIYTKFNFEDIDEPITLFDYYMNPEYAKFNLGAFIKAWTIGLPFKILGAIKGEEPDVEYVPSGDEPKLVVLTKDESDLFEQLEEQFFIDIDDKNGYITMAATMPEQIAATQVIQRISDLMQKYITHFKIEKAQENLVFVNTQFQIAKEEYDKAAKEWAEYSDANRSFTTKSAQIKMQQLQDQYTVAHTAYQNLKTQVLAAEIKVSEDTPIFSVIQPPYVPYEKSSMSKIKILFIWCVLGGLAAIGWVIGKDYYNNNLKEIVKGIFKK